jgi:hypothetical protein
VVVVTRPVGGLTGATGRQVESLTTTFGILGRLSDVGIRPRMASQSSAGTLNRVLIDCEVNWLSDGLGIKIKRLPAIDFALGRVVTTTFPDCRKGQPSRGVVALRGRTGSLSPLDTLNCDVPDQGWRF